MTNKHSEEQTDITPLTTADDSQDSQNSQEIQASPINTSSPRKCIYGLFTIEQLAIMMIYPVTLLLGQLVSLSAPEESYFSQKKNILNIIFVKKAWFWTTLVFGIKEFYELGSIWRKYHASLYSMSTVIRQAIARYIVATVWWIMFAQWMFGLPIMDRLFLLTGGACENIRKESLQVNLTLIGPGPHKHLSSATCRAHGGSWQGGYDPSGHVFILTHGSLFIWFEILPILTRIQPGTSFPTAFKIVLGFLTVWWYMFFMTSVYFHSFPEKLAGLVWGYLEIVVIYIIAERYPIGQAIFGKQL